MTGFKTVSAMVTAMIEELGITVPVATHLDHGTYDGCMKCIEAGFTLHHVRRIQISDRRECCKDKKN